MGENKLKQYREKRHFDKTPEPKESNINLEENPIFVVQKHQSRRLHYDFRIETDGVLKSWAIPKGPSLKPGEKRLAVQVEDHPVDYASFEGVIPEGEYGAGQVIVWDKGNYRNVTIKSGKAISVGNALEAGHLALFLYGQKLKGEYGLIRMGQKSSKNWLLIKKQDEWANSKIDIVSKMTKSVLSGRSIEELM